MKTSILFTFFSFPLLLRKRPPPKPETGTRAAAVETTSRTKHEMTVNGTKIPYTATAGTLILKKEDGKPWASMFYVAYTRDDTPDACKAPAHLLLQRRPRIVLGMAASRRTGTEAGRNGTRRPTARAALSSRR